MFSLRFLIPLISIESPPYDTAPTWDSISHNLSKFKNALFPEYITGIVPSLTILRSADSGKMPVEAACRMVTIVGMFGFSFKAEILVRLSRILFNADIRDALSS